MVSFYKLWRQMYNLLSRLLTLFRSFYSFDVKCISEMYCLLWRLNYRSQISLYHIFESAILIMSRFHEPISDEDARLLYSSGILSNKSPESLLNKVFFEIMLHLCRRGQENLREITTDDFEIIHIKDVECVVKKMTNLQRTTVTIIRRRVSWRQQVAKTVR